MVIDSFPFSMSIVKESPLFSSFLFVHPQCDPPIEVHDLFQDIRDGRILMALLEELSGCKLVSL